jgi:hypothetical protein
VITDVQEVGDRRAQGGAGARKIASGLGSPTVEAEHLLLAVARQPGTIAQQVLREAGLDYDRIGEALDAEFEGTLATVGVSLGDFDLSACGGTSRAARWGTSAKLALARSAKIADARRDRRMAPGHIVLGILRAPTGTVPRAGACWNRPRRAQRSRRGSALSLCPRHSRYGLGLSAGEAEEQRGAGAGGLSEHRLHAPGRRWRGKRVEHDVSTERRAEPGGR